MESLYRTYRPLTFDEVVGQAHVVNTLEHAIQENRLNHAYLFTGPRGTGKTTLARILAKALVCEAGPAHVPDGTCVQCQEIAQGSHPDVYELDAASRTGVDAVREEIVNRVDYAPTQGRSKVYIIDEVHMLTTQAFNALLKTLEEPPGHVVFILCTTDPQKIPATILSRVQRFDFHPISASDIEKHLMEVCQKEGFQADPAALALLTRHAQGGMRDALSLLEQLATFGNGQLTVEGARELLGDVGVSELSSVAMALAQNNTVELFAEVARILGEGQDIQQFALGVLSHLRDIYVVKIAGAAPGVLDVSTEVLETLQQEAEAFGTVAHLQNTLELFDKTVHTMKHSTQPRLDLEVAFARATKPSLQWEEDALATVEKRLEALEAEVQKPHESCGEMHALQPQRGDARTAVAQENPQSSFNKDSEVPAQKEEREVVVPAAQDAAKSITDKKPEKTPAPEEPALRQPVAEAPVQEVRQVGAEAAWNSVLKTIEKDTPALHGILMGSRVASETDNEVKIAVRNFSGFAESMLNDAHKKHTLQSAFKKAGNSKTLSFSGEHTVRASHAPEEQTMAAPPSPSSQAMAAPSSSSSSGDYTVDASHTPEDKEEIQQKRKEAAEQETAEREAVEQETAEQGILGKEAAEQEAAKKNAPVVAEPPKLSPEGQDIVNMITDSFGAPPTVLPVE